MKWQYRTRKHAVFSVGNPAHLSLEFHPRASLPNKCFFFLSNSFILDEDKYHLGAPKEFNNKHGLATQHTTVNIICFFLRFLKFYNHILAISEFPRFKILYRPWLMLLFCSCFFETVSHYAALADLEWAMLTGWPSTQSSASAISVLIILFSPWLSYFSLNLFIFIYFNVYECFAYMYVIVLHVCLVAP